MRRILISTVAAAAALCAQNDLYDAGAKVFKLSCAQGYCHGSGGTQGRAPKLIGQTYEAAQARKIIETGVPGTGMPGFKDRLNPEQLTSVVFYVVQISGGDTSKVSDVAAAGPKAAMPAAVAAGKSLFFNAQKGVHRCSTCHALEDIGLPVGPNLSSGGPYPAASIRAGKHASVRLATSGSDTFPALLASQKGEVTQVYDLTVAPPVLRSFVKGEVRMSGGAQWKHAEATRSYSDAELQSVAAYLAWIGER